jgi:hypothetical protein
MVTCAAEIELGERHLSAKLIGAVVEKRRNRTRRGVNEE